VIDVVEYGDVLFILDGQISGAGLVVVCFTWRTEWVVT